MTDKRRNVFKALTVAAVILSLALTAFRYSDAAGRLFTAFLDLGRSVAWYFLKLFLNVEEMPFDASVLNIPSVDIQKYIPFDLAELVRKWELLGTVLFRKECFYAYLSWLAVSFRQLLLLLMLLLMVAPLLYLILSTLLFSPQDPEKRNVDSKPLKVFKKLTFKPFFALKGWISDYRSFLLENKKCVVLLALIWIVNLNIATIVVEFVAFYFYFACEFSFLDIPGQLLKLLIDAIIMFSGAPLAFWLVVGFILFDKWRRAVGYDNLRHNELKNRGFINTLNLAVLICGSMGVSKTTALTDMVISQSIMFRDKALDKIQEFRYRFPNFPFSVLEGEVGLLMKQQKLKGPASVRRWVSEQENIYLQHPCLRNCFYYDVKSFSETYDDGLKISDCWDMISTYAQLYFIYSYGASITVSNYSIRECMELIENGHTPVWQTELFKRPSVPLDDTAHHSKIIDFDILRPGKKVIPENPNYGLFEFGVLAITEIGKERGNALENQELKKNSEIANPKNDKFNEFVKMIRHPATVDYYPFVRVFSDEQRPESLGSNDRDLYSLLWIESKEAQRLAMPGFLFGDILFDILSPMWKKFDLKKSINRSDNTLLGFIVINALSSFMRYRERIYNTFGYNRLRVEVESGRMDGEVEEHEYFLSSKKDYSRTFATDCFAEYFAVATLACDRGLDDLPEYETERPSAAEYELQNSYFIRNLSENSKRNSSPR